MAENKGSNLLFQTLSQTNPIRLFYIPLYYYYYFINLTIMKQLTPFTAQNLIDLLKTVAYFVAYFVFNRNRKL